MVGSISYYILRAIVTNNGVRIRPDPSYNICYFCVPQVAQVVRLARGVLPAMPDHVEV